MKYFFTSDTHFGHKNIIDYCKRPFSSVEEMDNKIIQNWNKTVSKKDTVFFLGDFCVGGNFENYRKKLNGNIIFIKGNHDKKTIIQDMIIDYGEHFWHLAHNPKDCCSEFNICGHIHEKWKIQIQKNNEIFVNVGVDQWDFRPIEIKDILNLIKTTKKSKKVNKNGKR